MIDWLDSNTAYWHWLVLGILISLLEIFIPSFFMLWLGVSAILVGAIMLVTDISFTMQLLSWIVLSTATTVLWFKVISPKMRDKSYAGMAKEAITGQTGTVISYDSESALGVIRFHIPIMGSSEWNFISDDDFKTGDRGRIVDLSGNKLIIKKS